MTIIKDLASDDMPREKLLRIGSENLSDSELLAIVLATSGMRGKSVLDLSREILSAFGSLRGVSGSDPMILKQVKGIGPTKAILLAAVFEIARRCERDKSDTLPTIKTPEEIAELYMPMLRDQKKEVFKVLLFNSRGKLIRGETVSFGGIGATSLNPHEIFHPAILEKAASVIMLHNHPSGDPRPSSADLEMTTRVVEIGKVIGIPVLDHIILGDSTFTSLSREGHI